MNELTPEIIESDLRPFSDVATEFRVFTTAQQLRVKMIRDAVERDYLIDSKTGNVTSRQEDGRRFFSLESLLASDAFADLRQLADNLRRIHNDISEKEFIPPEGLIDGMPFGDDHLASALAPVATAENDPIISRAGVGVVLIDGPAGVGKTSLIRRLVLERAVQYSGGGSKPPLLHVTSRGRRLTSLQETLALSTQLARAKFTFDQIPILVRRGLLQVAIDGFDELVDADGYKDAWFALRDFLREIASGWPIILAGRDTFFDQQGFLRHLESDRSRIRLRLVHLADAKPQAARDWLKKCGWTRQLLQDANDWGLFDRGSFALRPYFLSELAELPVSSSDELLINPRNFLIKRFIHREVGLITKALDLEITASSRLLSDLFANVAIEMAEEETDSVDLSFLEFLVELMFESVVDQRNIDKLKHRAGSIGLLDKDERPDRRRFPHSNVSNYFLCRGLFGLVIEEKCPRFLRRGVVSVDLLETLIDSFYEEAPDKAAKFVDSLEKILNREGAYERLGSNIGALLIATLSRPLNASIRRVSDLSIDEATILDAAASAELTNLAISRLDVRGADLRRITFSACAANVLVVDEATLFGASYPTTGCLQLFLENSVRPEFDPKRIEQWLKLHSEQRSAVSPTLYNDPYSQLLQRACYRTIRTHYIRDSDEDPAGALLQEPQWLAIEKVLVSHNRLERRDDMQASGPHRKFVHIKNAMQLLQKSSGDVESLRIWTEVAALSLQPKGPANRPPGSGRSRERNPRQKKRR